MNEIIFIETSSGQRTNILADFRLVSKETFLKDKKANRFGKIDGYVKLLKHMDLSDFEETFTLNEMESFTKKEITDLFGKDVSEKYGLHKDMMEIKPLKKSEILPGNFYETIGIHKEIWLYMGKVETTHSSYNNPKEIETKVGNLFVEKSSWMTKETSCSTILKGLKKFGVKVEDISFEDVESFKHIKEMVLWCIENDTDTYVFKNKDDEYGSYGNRYYSNRMKIRSIKFIDLFQLNI